MLKQELKKIFLKRYFLLFVIGVLVIEFAMCIAQSEDYFNSDYDKEAYEKYVAAYSGELTQAKAELMALNFEYINNPDEWKSKCNELLRKGKITNEVYHLIEELFQESKLGSLGVSVFQEDYEYFSSKTGREIIHAKAWSFIFGSEKIDFFLVLLCIVFAVSAYVSENETNITLMKNTAPKGGKNLYRNDLLLGVSFITLFSFVIDAMRLCVGIAQFSVNDFTSSLESLSVFENTSYNISLIEGYIFTTTIKAVGYGAFMALCFVLGNVFDSAVTVVMGGVLSVLLPQYVFKAPIIYYLSPISLMLSNGFLFGDSVLSGEDYGGTVVLSVSSGQWALPISLITATLIFAVAFFYVKKRGER